MVKHLCTIIILCFAISINAISPANADPGPSELSCPALSGLIVSNLSITLDIKALNFNGQYLQRVDPKTGNLVEKPQGILGCYKYFSTNTGYDARWDVGVIDFINGKLKWINHVGASWDLIADFTNLRFKTNETNPYFPASFFIERTFDPKSGESSTCKQFKRQGVGFPLDSTTINLKPDPVFLGVLIDFSEQYSKNTDEELSRFGFEKVENFWRKNSYGKSNLKIETHPTTVKLEQSGLYFEAGKEYEIWPIVIDRLSKSVDLSKYAGFVFATPVNGPRLQAGYAAQINVGKEAKKVVWMGGWNSSRENWVPVWKVVAHEFGHSYGLPDLYLTNGDNSAGKTLGPFDIMDGVTGISNSVTFIQRWMLGWLSDSDVECHIPDANPKTVYLKPVTSNETSLRGIIVPISEYESILIEARIKSEFDDLSGDQEGVLVYLSDTRIAGGKGPLRIISSKNSWTLDPKRMDDVERFKYGTLRSQERVSYEDTYVEFSGRDKDFFKVTITKGNDYFRAVDAKAAADKAAADKAAADKAAAIKKVTITCIKGKVTKKVTAVKPKCPAGYKKK